MTFNVCLSHTDRLHFMWCILMYLSAILYHFPLHVIKSVPLLKAQNDDHADAKGSCGQSTRPATYDATLAERCVDWSVGGALTIISTFYYYYWPSHRYTVGNYKHKADQQQIVRIILRGNPFQVQARELSRWWRMAGDRPACRAVSATAVIDIILSYWYQHQSQSSRGLSKTKSI